MPNVTKNRNYIKLCQNILSLKRYSKDQLSKSLQYQTQVKFGLIIKEFKTFPMKNS